MTWLKEVALPVLGKGWDAVVAFAKAAWAWLRSKFDTIVDPPPQTFRFYFWCAFGLIAFGAVSYAFVNSWYYKPVVSYFASLGDDGDVELPKLETLPPVPTPATLLPSVEVVCHDMSDTPHCESVTSQGSDKSVVADLKPQAVAKPTLLYKSKKKSKRVRPVKHEPYWPF